LSKLIVEEAPLTEELLHRKVAVATVRGRPYYNITNALKLMELQFDSLLPEEAAVSKAKVIITTQEEAGIVKSKGTVMLDTELEKYPAISKAKILRSIIGDSADDQLTIGIDPGSRIGISAIYLQEEIASAVESSPQDAIDQVSAMLGGIESHKKVVKIGDGNISMTRQIARMLKMKFRDSVCIEIVDEHGTSKNADTNKRGARDISSARTIAFRTGKKFELK
jgi:RNase H-fold protein (predicted Holliday junction resolvase)